MLISDMRLGGALCLGRHRPYEYGSLQAPIDLFWIKVSRQNEFMLSTRLRCMCFDEPEPAARSREHRASGSNFYPHSIVHQWLNARQETGWYVPSHQNDASTYYRSASGFLSSFTDDEYNLLLPRRFIVKTPQGSIRRHGETVEMEALVALPSAIEVTGIAMDSGYELEGNHFEYLKDTSLWANSMTRSAVGPGCIVEAYMSGRTTSRKPPSRCLDTRPIIQLKDSPIDPECKGNMDYFVISQPNPYDSIDEMEFLSLLRAR